LIGQPLQSITHSVPTHWLFPGTQISPHLHEYSTLGTFVMTGTMRQTFVTPLPQRGQFPQPSPPCTFQTKHTTVTANNPVQAKDFIFHLCVYELSGRARDSSRNHNRSAMKRVMNF